MDAQLRQVVYAATEFPSVKNVQILIEGTTVRYLGTEGMRLDAPLSRASFQNSARAGSDSGAKGLAPVPRRSRKRNSLLPFLPGDRRRERLVRSDALFGEPPQQVAAAMLAARRGPARPLENPVGRLAQLELRLDKKDSPALRGEAEDVTGRALQGPEGQIGHGARGTRIEMPGRSRP